MLKNLIRAFLVFRLELWELSIDLDLVLMAWHRRPVIQTLLENRERHDHRHERLIHKLDEVYPF